MAVNPIVTSVDPITFEILSHRVYQIAKEMGSTLERVGGTVNTTQMHDYMASLYLANGDVLSAGDAMGWHVAVSPLSILSDVSKVTEASIPMTFFCSTILMWRRSISPTST
jgi:N-methylhydantoinase B/oxoprolinase/acetone carboxylase alpha subunit